VLSYSTGSLEVSFSSMKMREMDQSVQGRLLGRCRFDFPKRKLQYFRKTVIFPHRIYIVQNQSFFIMKVTLQ